jgi:ABC-2 type transport system permease protein
MDLLLAQPVRRAGVVAAKTVAAITGTALIIAIALGGFAITMAFIPLEPEPSLPGEPVSFWDVSLACANMAPVTLAFFGLSLWLGAVAPTRSHAAAIAIGVATAAYVADYVAATIDAVSWLRYLSPFYYYGRGQPLVDGLDWLHITIMLASFAMFVLLSVRTFEHRDVATGGATGMRWHDLARRAAGLRS